MRYGDYEIRVEITPAFSEASFDATYEIYTRSYRSPICAGAIPGGRITSADAERAAYSAARRWIDLQPH